MNASRRLTYGAIAAQSSEKLKIGLSVLSKYAVGMDQVRELVNEIRYNGRNRVHRFKSRLETNSGRA